MRKSKKRQKLLKKVVVYVLLLIGIFFVLFPFFWMVSTSFKPPGVMFAAEPTLLPKNPTLIHYEELLNPYTHFVDSLKNSFKVALTVTLLVVIISTMGAYSITRFKYRGRDIIGRAVFIIYIFPGILTLIPFFVLMVMLGLYDKLGGLIVGYTVGQFALCMWILTGFFKGIPLEIEEAAIVDGASRFQALYRIILPLASPGIIAIAIFSFLGSWSEYLFALVMIDSKGKMTLPLVIASFMGWARTRWGPLLASSVLTIIPIIVLFTVLQKYLVEGLTAGAVKG